MTIKLVKLHFESISNILIPKKYTWEIMLFVRNKFVYLWNSMPFNGIYSKLKVWNKIFIKVSVFRKIGLK
jgi:hypothetical protein